MTLDAVYSISNTVNCLTLGRGGTLKYLLGFKRRTALRRPLFAGLLCLVWCIAVSVNAEATASGPRIVNIYNFIRNSDYRLRGSEDLLFDCTRRQIELLKKFNLPATWALQYDALMNPRYQLLLKQQLGANDEIAAWWEIPEALAVKAGIKWRGKHEWDPVANVGFSPGYAPDERRRLVDVYMADFKSIFGHYPRTVGSWFIDEVTLEYMADKYDVVASCNCKDQIGTDFYTLWGGYWNQAYYPSRLNSYMPAQTRSGQINMPVFRMLGSDPIYQHGSTPGLISLEPVYREGGGGMPQWVNWFMDNLVHQPCLAFAYTQTGQENSFGWDAMKDGFTFQARLFADLAKAGKIRVETLEHTGNWFRKNFSLTPATSVVALDDWKKRSHKTVWYDSRFYRLNILWDKNSFFVRDIHRFDENVISPTHNAPLMAPSLAYQTLPIVDWAFWSDSGRKTAGMFPVWIKADGSALQMQAEVPPVVKELNSTDLGIMQSVQGGGTFSIVCSETAVSFGCVDDHGKPLNWAWRITGGDRLKEMVKEVTASSIVYNHLGTNYQLKLDVNGGSCHQLEDGSVELRPNDSGKILIKFDNPTVSAISKNQTLPLSNQ